MKRRAAPSTAATVIFFLVVIGVGAFFGSEMDLWRNLQRCRTTYSTTTGLLTEVGAVYEYRSSSGRGGRVNTRAFMVPARYTFFVNGQTFHGERVGLLGDHRFPLAADAEIIRTAFAQRRPMTIRYNAADPTDNYLIDPVMDERARVRGVWITAGVIGLMFGLSIVMIGVKVLRRPS
ncbi:MAG TPA: hypothetical protein VD997_15235 [Phycisphaerales bacterium]|nr:hypothetical protein [Phycisphaerales bacterium]